MNLTLGRNFLFKLVNQLLYLVYKIDLFLLRLGDKIFITAD